MCDNDETDVIVVSSEDIPIHPSYTSFYSCSVPGNVNVDIAEIKAVLNYENVLYAVAVAKNSDVVLWQTHLPLSDSHNVCWTVVQVMDGPSPLLEIDFLSVMHLDEIWLLPVTLPKVVFVFTLGKGEWTRRPLSGSQLSKVTRASSFGEAYRGIYVASDTQHGLLDTATMSVRLFDSPPTTQMDDCFVMGDKVYGGDNGALYLFERSGTWNKILEAPKATFWSSKGNLIYCFIKSKQHGKPLQICLAYHTDTKAVQLLDCKHIIPGETPFPYEIPSPIVSHGPYFFFFTEDLRVIYAFDVFTFSPHQPLHQQWKQFVNSPKFSDIAFSVGGKTFHGHKVLLSSYEYFAKLIDFPSTTATALTSQQAQENAPGGLVPVVTINDMSAEAFGQLLHFLYCGQLNSRTIGPSMSTSTTIELLFAGNKYLLQSLAYQCSEALVNQIEEFSLKDLVAVLEAAYTVDESGLLYKKALETLFDRHPRFMAEPDFIQLSQHNMEFYRKVLSIATQFVVVDRAKLLSKSNCSLTFN